MKYKIGDKVKILDNSVYCGITGEIGKVIAIEKFKCVPTLYLVRLNQYPDGLYFESDCIEKIKLKT